jgi:Tol biopolymer transport system component/DNA-binding winged helix-turn-helix (wHTH) protein
MHRPAIRFYEFGPFSLDTADFRLFRDGVEVPLPNKVLETLLVLLEKPGQLVSKDKLMERVWPGTFVGDDSLAQNISLLRKALDDGNGSNGYITTVPKLGYRFTGALSCKDSSATGIHSSSAARSGASTPRTRAARMWRNRWLMAGVALAILLCGLAVKWLFVWRSPTLWAANFRITKLDVSNIALNGSISPSGNYFAYVAQDKGTYSIWVRPIASEGAGLRILSGIPVPLRGLTYSPNEEYLYYILDYIVGGPSQEPNVLYRINSLGGTPQRLLEGIMTRVRFDPGGQRMVYMRSQKTAQGGWLELVVARMDGTEAHPIAKSDWPRVSEFYGPHWPLNNRIVYGQGVRKPGGFDWYVVEIPANGGKETRIFGPQSNPIDEIQTLNRSELLALATDPQSGILQVWILNRNGQARRVTNDTNRYTLLSVAQNAHRIVATRFETEDTLWVADANQSPGGLIVMQHVQELKLPRLSFDDPAWTPDGNIVYSSRSEGNGADLWWVRSDGTGQRQITSNGAPNFNERVSPDGKYLVFTLFRNGTSRIWRVDIDGSNPRQLTEQLIEGSQDTSPQVSPDGKWVVYKVFVPAANAREFSVWKVPSGGGTAVKVADSVQTADRETPLVSPDGKWIAFQHISATDHQKRWGIFSFENGSLWKEVDLAKDAHSVSWSHDGKSLKYLSEVGNTMQLISQPITGKPSRMILDFDLPDVQFVDWSKDGKKILFVRKTEKHDLVLIEEAK